MHTAVLGLAFWLAAGPAPADKAPADEVKSLIDDYQKARQAFSDKLRAAATPEEQEKLADQRPKPEPVAARLLELAEANPKDPGVVPEALVRVVTLPLQGADGAKLRAKALDLLARGHADSDQFGALLTRLAYTPTPAAERLLRAVLEKNPKDELKGKAAYGLGALLKEAAETARTMKEQADAAKGAEDYLGKEAADWLRDADPARLDKDAEAMFELAADKYGDVKLPSDDTLGELARAALFEIRNLAVGKVAPEIEGDDLDGKAFKLSDYRGKVVVLDFWGNW